MNLLQLTNLAVQAALAAGRVIQLARQEDIVVAHKEAGDTLASQVVTEIDRRAQDAILDILLPTCREYDLAVLTEESEDDGGRFEKEFFWCIDPMDGTLPFIEGRPGYSVSIALVARDGTPQLGVVFDPVHDVLYQATRGHGMRRNGDPWTLASAGTKLTFAYDRSFLQHPAYDRVIRELESYAAAQGLKGVDAIQQGGSVMNAVYALEQSPGCHFKFPKPQEGGGSLWDYAATACLYQEAGAVVSDVFGDPLDLNRKESTFMNHRGAIYATDEGLAEKVRTISAEENLP